MTLSEADAEGGAIAAALPGEGAGSVPSGPLVALFATPFSTPASGLFTDGGATQITAATSEGAATVNLTATPPASQAFPATPPAPAATNASAAPAGGAASGSQTSTPTTPQPLIGAQLATSPAGAASDAGDGQAVQPQIQSAPQSTPQSASRPAAGDAPLDGQQLQIPATPDRTGAPARLRDAEGGQRVTGAPKTTFAAPGGPTAGAPGSAAGPTTTAGGAGAPQGQPTAQVQVAATGQQQVPVLDDAAIDAQGGEDAQLETPEVLDTQRAETASPRGPERAAPAARANALDVAAFAARFAKKLAGGATRFQIRLDPPELGRVEVRVEVSADGVAHARLTAERPDALAELARHARALERQLAEAGVELAEGGLSFDLADADSGALTGRDEAEHDDASAARQSALSTDDEPSASDIAGADVASAVEIDTSYGYAVLRRARTDVTV